MKAKYHFLTIILLLAAMTNGFGQPVITNQPQNLTNIVGTTAIFTVGATGTPPLFYQWRRNGPPIPGETNATLVVTNVQPPTKNYSVMVSNADGSVISTNARLFILVPPVISQQPANQSAEVGETVAFTVSATGTAPLSYQWLFNGQTLAGQTGTNLTWVSVQLSNAGAYSVVVTNSAGSTNSQIATLTVVPPIFTKITNGSIVNDGGYSFGCAWGDYDNDGFLDLFVANDNGVGTSGNDFLYHNDGNGTFSRITAGPIVNDGVWSISGAWGDYDNDGNLDLFVSMPDRPNTLYRNDGNGAFTKIINGPIATDSERSHTGIWGDFDNDGWLDVFIANFAQAGIIPKDNVLYRSDGNGGFIRTSFGPKTSANGQSWNAAAADFNNDGWLDLFVPQGGAQLPQNSLLYTNNGGALTLLTNSVVFTNKANGVACAWGDYDNDGLLDLFVSNFYGQNNFLYHNNGDSTFTKITNSPVTLDGGTSVGCAWGDYDNDGWLDLFVANLGPVDPATLNSIAPENNFLYHNNGDGTFTKVTSGSLVNDLGYSTGCAWADYDNDGFLDLFVANGWATTGENNFLYRNNGNTNRWLNLKLVGTVSNRSAIGAKVRVKATIGGKTFWQMREISGGSNYGSQNDMRPSFGLGDATHADLVRIEWPSGAVQELYNVAARQFLTVTEPPRLLASKTTGEPQFSIKGRRGSDYQVDTSTNLTTWSSLGTVTITNQNGTARIIETNTPAAALRFYRAVSR